MSRENDLMKLVADYGKECISAGIAELNSNEEVKKRMAEDVRKSHNALTERLRAILTEMEAAREDAARYRWLRDDSRECPRNMGEIYVTQHALPNDEDSMDHDLFMDALDSAIDAARKGEA